GVVVGVGRLVVASGGRVLVVEAGGVGTDVGVDLLVGGAGIGVTVDLVGVDHVVRACIDFFGVDHVVCACVDLVVVDVLGLVTPTEQPSEPHRAALVTGTGRRTGRSGVAPIGPVSPTTAKPSARRRPPGGP